MRRSFGTALVRLLRRVFITRLTDRYRPELHYMRGPGPKSKGRGGAIASLGNGGKSSGT